MNAHAPFIPKAQSLALQYAGYVSVGFIFANYFATGVTTVLSILVGILWLCSGRFMKLPQLMATQPVALWALLLFGFLSIAAVYSSAPLPNSISILGKYRELLYIPILLTIFNASSRQPAWLAFIFASIITLFISYLKFFGVLPLNKFGDPAIKSHITHSMFIALFAFYCLHKIADSNHYRYLYLALFGICLHNLFFAVEGRTGQAVFLGLALLFTLQRFRKKQLLLCLTALALLMLLYINFSEKAQRLNEGINETQTYLQENQTKDMAKSPMAQRYMFWKYSIKLIAEKPLLGHGTGSFAQEYKRIATGERILTVNAHNEFIMLTVQIGIIGLLVYLGFLGSQLYAAQRLPSQDKFMAQGVFLTLTITSVFNSPILDNTEGQWFAAMIALCFGALPVSPIADHA